MFYNRSLRRDLFALALLGSVLFLAFALATYHPADPVRASLPVLDNWYHPDQLVYPQNEQVLNSCGIWGALAADMAFHGLGVGAYFLVISLAAVDIKLLRRFEIDTPLIRLLGWATALVGLTALASMIVPSLSGSPMIGSGGYLGALVQSRLQAHFAVAGSLILASSMLIGGLFIWADYTFVRWLTFAVAGLMFGLSTGRNAVSRRIRRRSSETEDAETGDEMEIRIRGKKLTKSANRLELEATNQRESESADVVSATAATGANELTNVAATASVKQAEIVEPLLVKNKKKPKPSGDAPAPHFKVRDREIDREAVMTSLDEASLPDRAGDYELPSVDMLIPAEDVCYEAQALEVRRKAKILEKTFADFGFQVKVVEIETGPVIAQYEVELEAGLRLSKITGLADDLAIALRVPSVRIVAPIPGKNTVGIEVPNEVRQVVRLREVVEESNGKTKKMKVPLFLGKDVSGNALVVDLATLPHLLIAGRTGTGKSVCLNAIICSMLMTRRPDEVRLLMIDPKMVELSGYSRLPHLMHPVVTDMRKAEAILAWAVEKMEERYALLARAGVRHISSYNQLGEEELMDRLKPENDDERKSIPQHLPFIVIVADEMADLMMTSGKEVEQHIIRLAQKSRAVGIHLILATQKPTVDVITGLIKSNLPARIAFQVASRTDSRVVLDEMGADKLLGNGDMLFLWPGTSSLLRGQGTYLSDEEINSIVECVSTGEPNYVNELMNLKVERPAEGGEPTALKKRDELYEAAVDLVVREGRGSVSLLQRALGIGYGRAARLIDYMAEDNIVGTYNGSQAREILISLADWERMQSGGNSVPEDDQTEASPSKPKSRSSNMTSPTAVQDTGSKPHSKSIPRLAVNDRDEDDVPEDEEEEENEEDVEDDVEDDDDDLWEDSDEEEGDDDVVDDVDDRLPFKAESA